MRNFFILLLLFSLCLSASAADEDKIVVIRDRTFIGQVNDIHLNRKEYDGRVIRYEGIYMSYSWQNKMEPLHYVLRYGPGCCANDGEIGFEIFWDGKTPDNNDWCEVIGIIEYHIREDGWVRPCVRVTSIKVLEKRGAEFVK